MGVFLRTDDVPSSGFPELITNESQIFKVGALAQIQDVHKTDHGTRLILMGHRRITFENFTNLGPPVWSNVTHWKKPAVDKVSSLNLKAYTNEVMAVVREIIRYNPLLQEMLQQWITRIDFSDPFKMADFATALTSADGPDLQKVLEASVAEVNFNPYLFLLNFLPHILDQHC